MEREIIELNTKLMAATYVLQLTLALVHKIAKNPEAKVREVHESLINRFDTLTIPGADAVLADDSIAQFQSDLRSILEGAEALYSQLR